MAVRKEEIALSSVCYILMAQRSGFMFERISQNDELEYVRKSTGFYLLSHYWE